ncbi:aspartyl-phosphate phosphatase Spo0E family protein [Pseudogracilibacillus sp. SE30717A]|uniref:aspartyl-phosphate phosphatase Spo0E family protein n=1 Tax=Pseudogracilibacillus sp. SE30717A TaxID=3098293 RepID=UPI00300DECEB
MEKELSKKIEALKLKMIRISDENGMNNSLTIQISQELDKLINEYMELTQKKNIE